MSVIDYSGSIKITFDKPIVTEIGSIYNMLAQSLGTVIYTSQTRGASRAFDDSTGTQWEPSSAYPQHIGKNFGSAKSIGKIRVYLGGGWVPNGYKVRASTDGLTWVDIATGNFSNNTGWQEVTFTPISYQYWCLQILSAYKTYTWVYELQFYELMPSFPIAGWVITGYEPSMIPDGSLVLTTYTVKRVTKSEDNLSILVWLKLSNRMRYPHGLITVQYIKSLGGLAGAFGSSIEDFNIQFTPTNITPIFNPHTVEMMLFIPTANSEYNQVYYSSSQNGSENIEFVIHCDGTLTHVDDIET